MAAPGRHVRIEGKLAATLTAEQVATAPRFKHQTINS
jgi:hypothetical protein